MTTHAYHVNTGNFREHRGFFRLADYPSLDRRTLCSGISGRKTERKFPEGTYSHDTSLSLHELSDIMPSKLHLSAPRTFRRDSAIPGILVLHRADLDADEVQEMHGVCVTRPLRTIADMLQSGHLDRSQLKQAVDDRIQRGLIARTEIDRMPHKKLQRSLRELAGEPA